MKEFFTKHPIATFFCVDAIVTGVVEVVKIIKGGPKTVYIERNDENTAELDEPEETIEEEGS